MSRLNILGVCIAFWGLFWPHPYFVAMALLALCPMAAIVLLTQFSPTLKFGHQTRGAAPSVFPLFMFPGTALSLRAMGDVKLLDWPYPLACALLCGALISFLVARYDAEETKPQFLILNVFIASIIAWGALMHANKLLDSSEPTEYRVTVRDKAIQHGRAVTYWLTLAPWGPFPASQQEVIPHGLYDRTKIGDTVCIDTHAGALRWRWYDVRRCIT